ncbi:MAG TPA: vWA domain-containing protein [Ktedonobacteraceae bacterium]
MHKNNQKISSAEPGDRARLKQENDEIWDYIKDFLADYASLCEKRRFVALDDIIDIAATRFPEIFARLEAISASPSSLAGASEETKSFVAAPLSSVEHAPLFQISYNFVRPFIHNDEEELARFALHFRSNAPTRPSSNLVKHICLLLDVSGSMQKPDKYPYLLEAIPRVVDSLADQDWLTVILFSNESELIWSMNIASSRIQASMLRSKVEQSPIKFHGTFLAPGLRIALDQVQHFHRSVPQAIDRFYILTDGQLHDDAACLLLNPELRRMEIEVTSFGFGQDFAEATMRQVMEGCSGGRVKWIPDTDTLLGEFYHIGEMAGNVIATGATLELMFAPGTTPGDAFRYEPGRYHFGSIDDRKKLFSVSPGPLEKDRSYIYAFETRVYPSSRPQEKLARASLKYIVNGTEQTLRQDIVLKRSREPLQLEQIQKEVEIVFLILEELRTTDPERLLASLRARLGLLANDRRNQAQATLLKTIIGKLEKKRAIEAITDDEMRLLRADTQTQATYPREWQQQMQSIYHLEQEIEDNIRRMGLFQHREDAQL